MEPQQRMTLQNCEVASDVNFLQHKGIDSLQIIWIARESNASFMSTIYHLLVLHFVISIHPVVLKTVKLLHSLIRHLLLQSLLLNPAVAND